VATKAGLSLRFPWLVTADLSRQIETVTASVTRSTSVAEVADGLRAILDLIKRDELTPVLIFDDTDSWLSRPYHPDPEPMIQAFFGQALPWLAKQCAPTSIVAVHTTYLDSDAYEEAEKNGDLQRRITVPHLTDVSQLHTIIDAHITASTLALDDDEVFTADAVEELFRYYVHAARQSLRKVVVVAKLGLDAAEIAGAGVVDRSHVAPTVLEFS